MRKLLLGSISFLLFASIAVAGPEPPAPVDLDFRKAAGTKWIEFTSVVKNVGKEKESVFWRIRNRDSQKRKLKLVENLSGDGVGDYKVRWLTGGDDISNKVDDSSGYKFDLASKEKRVFEVTLQGKNDNPGPLCVTPFFYVVGEPNPYTYGLYVNDGGVCG